MSLRSRISNLFRAPPPRPTPQPTARADSPAPAMTHVDARAAMSRRMHADSMFNALTGVGGANDKGAAARPVQQIPLSEDELDWLYRTSGLAARICDLPARDMTARGWVVSDGTQVQDPMREEDRRLRVRSRLRDGVRWARQGGGALILMVVDDGGMPLDQPLDLRRVRALRNLVVLQSTEFSASVYEADPASPLYRRPAVWHVYPRLARGPGRVHASRALYIHGAPLPAMYELDHSGRGESYLQRCWEAIRNRISIAQNGAGFTSDIRNRFLRITGLADAMSSDVEDAVTVRLRQFARTLSNFSMGVLDKEEDVTAIQSNLTGFDHLAALASEEVACASEIPETLLFGSPPGGLSTDGLSWQVAWGAKIAGDQADKLYDPLVQLYRVIYAQQEGPFGGRIPKSWDVEFLPISTPSAKEEAAINKLDAEADAIRISSGVLGAQHVARSRFPPSGTYGRTMLPVPDAGAGVPGGAGAGLVPGAGEDEEEARTLADIAAAVGARADEIDLTPPEGAAEEAQRGLDWREEFGRGGTAVGVARARDLANRTSLSPETVARMVSFFARHAVDKQGKGWAPGEEGFPSAGRIAWALWGGDAGRTWAEGVRERLLAEEGA